LRLALSQDDKVTALKKVSGLTVGKIIEARETWFSIEQDLKSRREMLKEVEKDKKRENRKALIKAFKADIEAIETKLSKTVYLPLLIELRRDNEAELTDTLQLMIIDVVKFYHTSEKMDQAQIYETAFRISDTFKGLTLEDVALCFYRAKAGEYGTVFNRIDGAVIMDWLHKYQDKMQAIGMEKQLQLHLQSKGSTYKDGGEYRVSDIQKINEYFK
jgi:hypothetical protein